MIVETTSPEQPPTSGKSVDAVLSDSTLCNFWHCGIHLTTFYILVTTVCHTGSIFFTGHSPPWRCINESKSDFCLRHNNVTFTSDADMFNQRCHLNRTEWTYMTSPDYSFVTEFDLVCDKSSVFAFIGATFYVGCVLGAFLCGPISDSFGRKISLILGLVILIVSLFSTRYVQRIWELYLVQFVRGIGMSACQYLPFVYMSEFSPPAYRSIASNIGMVIATFSFMFMDLLAYLLQRWRYLNFTLSLLSIPALILMLLLPESPRWLHAKGRTREAECVLRKLTKFKGKLHKESYEAEHILEKKIYTYVDLFNNRCVYFHCENYGSMVRFTHSLLHYRCAISRIWRQHVRQLHLLLHCRHTRFLLY